MKANELRSGSVISIKGETVIVDHIKCHEDSVTIKNGFAIVFNDGDLETDGNDNIKPIVLTPEILEKCGFRKEDESYFNEAGEKIHQSDSFKLRTKNSKLHIRYLYQTKEFLFWITYNYEPERNSIHSSELFYYKDQLVFRKSEIYIHQLQNLIHALTGEELEVKL